METDRDLSEIIIYNQWPRVTLQIQFLLNAFFLNRIRNFIKKYLFVDIS